MTRGQLVAEGKELAAQGKPLIYRCRFTHDNPVHVRNDKLASVRCHTEIFLSIMSNTYKFQDGKSTPILPMHHVRPR